MSRLSRLAPLSGVSWGPRGFRSFSFVFYLLSICSLFLYQTSRPSGALIFATPPPRDAIRSWRANVGSMGVGCSSQWFSLRFISSPMALSTFQSHPISSSPDLYIFYPAPLLHSCISLLLLFLALTSSAGHFFSTLLLFFASSLLYFSSALGFLQSISLSMRFRSSLFIFVNTNNDPLACSNSIRQEL